MSDLDNAFEMATSNLRFGAGVTDEVGMDCQELGLRRVMVVTDPRVRALPPVERVLASLRKNHIDFDVFDRVRVEPSHQSFHDAIAAAKSGKFDGYVAVGGGSAIDTAKVANLYTTYPAEFLTYVNAPVGAGQPVPGPLKPLIAIPTTAGTGSETTGVAIFDYTEQHAKTGIAHRRLKPTLGLVDPENTRTQPAEVAASAGLDVLCHAVESYTAIRFDQRPRPDRPATRPAYQGNNPVSDVWSERAMVLVSRYLLRAVRDTQDDEARWNMLLASSFAGMGFGNAGCHLCHGMSYPISSMVRGYTAPGYPADHPMVPHGVSVILSAPAVFRFTASACPDRHLRAASLLGADITDAKDDQAGEVLAQQLIDYMRQLAVPNGISAVGFSAADCPALAKGASLQQRVTKLSPRVADEQDLARLFEQSLTIW